MSGLFGPGGASGAALKASWPGSSTGYPLTVGCWAYSASNAGNTGYMWSVVDTSVASNSRMDIAISGDGAGNLYGQLRVTEGTANNFITLNGAPYPVGNWAFFLARFITATNQRFLQLAPSGQITRGSATTTRNVTGLDTMMMGAEGTGFGTYTGFLDGLVAELWWADADIRSDGGTETDDFVRQLAFNGPFSIPQIIPNIMEYHSLRSLPTAPGLPTDHYYRGVPTGWTDVSTSGSVALGSHPPAAKSAGRIILPV